jgi:type III secretion protein Q
VSSGRLRPFPWEALDLTTRAEVAALRDARRWAAGHVGLERLGSALGALIGAPVDVRLGRARPFGLRSAVDGWHGVTFARADEATPAVLVEVEPALAANVVGRALRRPAAPLTRTDAPSSPAIAGALAAVLLAAARRAHAGLALRVLGVGPVAPLEAPFAALELEPWAISLTVLVADDAFAARAVVTRAAAFTVPPAPWTAATLAALGPVPLAIPIVACATQVTASELASLRPGDAFVPFAPVTGDAAWPLSRGAQGLTGLTELTGAVWLSAPSSDVGLRADLAADGRLVLRGELESLVTAETPMDADEHATVVATLGEVPVVVRVEIGEAQMTAREWASLGRGDVIALGRRVGELVVLRIGGVAWARGELVDLEGEVAVRIVERVAGEEAAP